MNESSERLIRDLKLNEGKPNFSRKFNFRVFPFYTRNPERAKFKDGFNPVLGAVARNSLGLKSNFGVSDYNIDKVLENVDIVEGLDEGEKTAFLKNLFDYTHLDSFNHPYLINYLPLSEGRESQGEIAIADFLVEFFKLKNNKEWKGFIGNKESNNLVEKILLESVSTIESENKDNIYFPLTTGLLEERFDDLRFLLKHKDFALKYLSLFFSFYYFQYLVQTSLVLDRVKDVDNDEKLYQLYFTLENERITGTRQTNKKGFNLIRESRDFLLVNENLLGYLNTLIGEEQCSFNEMLKFDNCKKETLYDSLFVVLEKYREITKRNDDIPEGLIESIELFKKWLSEDISKETRGRYYLSIEEIGDAYFLKRRGKLGKVLTLRKDMIILLTAIVVKNEKVVIGEVFKRFENRGVFLDRYSKEEIISMYEKMGILDKKSDSGEAKYVKPIL